MFKLKVNSNLVANCLIKKNPVSTEDKNVKMTLRTEIIQYIYTMYWYRYSHTTHVIKLNIFHRWCSHKSNTILSIAFFKSNLSKEKGWSLFSRFNEFSLISSRSAHTPFLFFETGYKVCSISSQWLPPNRYVHVWHLNLSFRRPHEIVLFWAMFDSIL